MKTICVYCGSSQGNGEHYIAGARDLAIEMTRQDIGLVYGGASIGVMGAVADEVLKQGGRVTGVIPSSLVDLEIAHDGLTELLVVADMHARKAAMAERASGFIALPGGLGTLEELFEVLTWAQLGIHAKPCGVLNTNGYYDGLLDFVDWQVSQGFVRPDHRQLILADSEPAALLQKFADYEPVENPKIV